MPAKVVSAGVVEGYVNPSVTSTPHHMEDPHADLLEGLASGVPYDILQLDPLGDPGLVGLLVDGRLRATYRNITVYERNSKVAQVVLDKAAACAARSQFIVRNFNRGVRGAVGQSTPTVPTDVGPQPTRWEAPEFVAPPLSTGEASAHAAMKSPAHETQVAQTIDGDDFEVATRSENLVDLGTTVTGKRVLDDFELADTEPAFLKNVQGLAGHNKGTEWE